MTLFRLLTGEMPETVSEADRQAAGDEMLAWEQPLLARVRAMTTARERVWQGDACVAYQVWHDQVWSACCVMGYSGRHVQVHCHRALMLTRAATPRCRLSQTRSSS